MLLAVAQGSRRRPHHHVPQDGRRTRPRRCRLGSEPRRHRAEPGRDPSRACTTSTCSSASTCSRTRRRAASRKPGSVTYLIPTAAHVEKAGSATNSGRTLQWRYQAAEPAGNSKDDNELLLRFAKALDDRWCVLAHHGRVGQPTASRTTPPVLQAAVRESRTADTSPVRTRLRRRARAPPRSGRYGRTSAPPSRCRSRRPPSPVPSGSRSRSTVR